jgi:hypothetical protein
VPFVDTMGALLATLNEGTEIPNWTIDGGLRGDMFHIISASLRQVTVETPNARHLQKIPMGDFAAVYELWNGYCRGTVPRSEIRSVTRYSKYIISIYHWLETEVRWRVYPGYNY